MMVFDVDTSLMIIVIGRVPKFNGDFLVLCSGGDMMTFPARDVEQWTSIDLLKVVVL